MGVMEGNLSAKPFALLLGELHAAKAGGALKLQWGMGRRTIYFEQGRPVFVTGIPMTDNLGTMLLNERRIGPSVRAEALRRARVKNRPIGAALVELGALTPDELEQCLARQLENRLLEPFAWTGGDYSFAPGARAPAKVPLLGRVDELLRKGIELGLACEPMEGWVRAAAGLALLPGPRAGDGELRSGRPAEELAAIALAGGGPTVGEFLDRCGLERGAALKLLAELLALQHLTLAYSPKVLSLSAHRSVRPPPVERAEEGRREKDGDNLIRLGRVCLSRAKAGRRGFAEAAEAYLLRAADLLPGNPDALLLLAELEQSRANHDLARRYQDKARRMSGEATVRREAPPMHATRLKVAIGVFALAAAALLTAPRLWDGTAPALAGVQEATARAEQRPRIRVNAPTVRTADLPAGTPGPTLRHATHREPAAGQR